MENVTPHAINVMVTGFVSGLLVVAWTRSVDRWMRLRTVGLRIPTLLIRDVIVVGLVALVSVSQFVVLVHAQQANREVIWNIGRAFALILAALVWLYYEFFIIERS